VGTEHKSYLKVLVGWTGGVGHNIIGEICARMCQNTPSAPWVNFTNILRHIFLYKSAMGSLYELSVWVCNLLLKEISAKAACKMLLKLIKC
jgi:hypothetical protein